MRGAEAFLVSW